MTITIPAQLIALIGFLPIGYIWVIVVMDVIERIRDRMDSLQKRTRETVKEWEEAGILNEKSRYLAGNLVEIAETIDNLKKMGNYSNIPRLYTEMRHLHEAILAIHATENPRITGAETGFQALSRKLRPDADTPIF